MAIDANLDVESKKTLAVVADEILEAWYQAHGVRNGSAQVMVGENSVAVCIENGLSVGERQMAGEARGRDLLDQYVRKLMLGVCHSLIPSVEAATEQSVQFVEIHADSAVGWIMCVFKLRST